jgi:hypothetical protein
MFYAELDSPTPSIEWGGQSDFHRIEKIKQIIDRVNPDFNRQLLIVATKNDGQVVVRLLNSLATSMRGTLLLDFEECIKKNIDQGLTVWVESLGDKNSLRNLRGIDIKVL